MSGNPVSASDYQYQSLAVQKENLANVYHDDNSNMFFSFIIVLPTLAVTSFFIIIFSIRNSMAKAMKKHKQHKTFAAVIGMGLNIAAYVTALDIWGLFWFTNKDHGGSEIYFSTEDTKYDTFKAILILHVVVEVLIYCLGEIWFFTLTIGQCCKVPDQVFLKLWWTHLLLFIPPIWCLASHFGFIVIAWSSFVRRGKAITLVYIIGAAAMFIVMRQTYKLIDKKKDGRERGAQMLNEENGKKEQEGERGAQMLNEENGEEEQEGIQMDKKDSGERGAQMLNEENNKEEQEVIKIDKRDGGERQDDTISFRIILAVRLVGFILVCMFVYIMWGLWLVPESETVEESPVYFSHSLHLIIVVLAFLVSYKISFGDDKVVQLLKEIRDGQPLRNEDARCIPSPSTPTTSPSTPTPSCSPKSCIQGICNKLRRRKDPQEIKLLEVGAGDNPEHETALDT